MNKLHKNAKRFADMLGCAAALVLLLSLLTAYSVVAADGDWPQFQKNEINTGVTESSAPVENPYLKWSVFTHYRNTHGIDVTPVIYGGKVFVIDVDGYAWAFDAETGEEVWSTELEDDTRYSLTTPACADGKVFFATDKGYIYALSADSGDIIWSGKLTLGSSQEAELNTQIVYSDGKLYIGSWEGKYYCLDAGGNGEEPQVDWVYDNDDTRYDWYSSAAVMGDYCLFGNTDSVLTCVDKNSGEFVDNLDVVEVFDIPAGSIRSGVSCNDYQDNIFFTSKNGYIFALGFNNETGEFETSSAWYASIDNYSTSTPVYYDGYLYVCSGGSFAGQEGGVYCFNAVDGEQEWFSDIAGSEYGSQASPAISLQDDDLFIYVTTGEPEAALCCLDADGNQLWEYVPADGYTEYTLQGAAVYDEKVYFANDAGYLFALASSPGWDLNGDGSVNVLDLILVGNSFGESGEPGWITADVNSDGSVNVLDMILVGNYFGE